MKSTLLFLSFLALLFSTQFTSVTAQVNDNDKHQFGVRFIAPNYASPLENIPSNFLGKENFGSGLQMEYQRRLAGNFLLGVPLSISSADAITNQEVDLTSPISLSRDIKSISAIGIDLLAVFEPIARRSFFDPQIFGGIGAITQSFEETSIVVPVGINLNFNLGESVYFSPQVSYRLALDNDDIAIRDNLQLGAGLHFQLGRSTPKPPPPPKVVDTDGDGIEDAADQCPTEAGSLAMLGCPDTDGDGIADKNDKCPEVAGLTAMMGCPDSDSDGITDADDKCPVDAGPASNDGCPVTDRDGDGTPDAEDECPDLAGKLKGCPDTDGDGVADKDDDCPSKSGPIATRGCPDTDGDGLLDKDDKCPRRAGPASNQGCPEITVEDRETIDFAIQNINFETASSVIRADSREVLAKVIDIMNRYPGYKLGVGGHTDSIGSADSNMSLSERRAQSVMKYLTDNGVPATRVSATGYGETRPIADNRYKDGREQNRRVTLDLIIE